MDDKFFHVQESLKEQNSILISALSLCVTVKQLIKDEKKYYEKLLSYSREHLMVSDVIV